MALVSLRNRQAAAKWLLQRRQRQPTLRIAVMAAGERWPDGSLRPAIEDQWGAGGRELIEIGFADDVRTAAQLDCSGVVPLLRDGAFIPA